MTKCGSSTKFDLIWKLMSEHKFVVDPDSIHEDLSCFLCNNLMVDACQTPCGCQYCYKCLDEYLTEGDKYCRGGKEECNEQLLVRERDLIRDPKTNNKILKTRVLCPNQSCKAKRELTRMEEHLTVCNIQSTRSEYASIGCDNTGEEKDTILEDLRVEILTHTELMMNNLKNEFDCVKKNLDLNIIEVGAIKEDSKIKDIQLNEIKNLKDELRNKENRIILLEQQLVDIKATIMKELDGQRRDIEALKNSRNQSEDEQIQQLKSIIKEKVDDSERKTLYYIKWPDVCPDANVDFAWKIEDLSHKRWGKLGSMIYSKAFNYNSYKLCMCMAMKGDNILLGCHLMKGDNDTNLDWPMPNEVTLSIIDQTTMQPHQSESFEYNSYSYKYRGAFNRPLNNRNNNFIGKYSFIRYSNIKDEESIVCHDSIIVTCHLDDPDQSDVLSDNSSFWEDFLNYV